MKFLLLLLVSFILPSYGMAIYPAKPINIYIPFPSGGASHTLVEQISNKAEKKLGQKIIIHSNEDKKIKPIEYIRNTAQLSNDGYHFVVGNLGTHGSAPSFEGMKLRYDPLEDFIPIAMLGQTPMYILIRHNLCLKYKNEKCHTRVDNLAKLQKYMWKYRGHVTMGHSGEGSTSYLAALHFNSLAKTKPTLVRYRGSTPALEDISEGFLDVLIDQSTSALPYIKGKTVKALAHTWEGDRNDSVTPNISSFHDNIGWHEFNITGWNILFAPRGTPKIVVNIMNEVVRDVLKNPVVKGSINLRNTLVYPDNKNRPNALKYYMRNQIDHWQEIIKEQG